MNVHRLKVCNSVRKNLILSFSHCWNHYLTLSCHPLLGSQQSGIPVSLCFQIQSLWLLPPNTKNDTDKTLLPHYQSFHLFSSQNFIVYCFGPSLTPIEARDFMKINSLVIRNSYF